MSFLPNTPRSPTLTSKIKTSPKPRRTDLKLRQRSAAPAIQLQPHGCSSEFKGGPEAEREAEEGGQVWWVRVVRIKP
ncbi:hypothetical protein Vadar_029967 [Vaccinium darrowii]|uniref:Uncharacterized protein n=1 Tax=Vaccinium darrowii TaxID=229202 RepID=A0ACB7Y414_9ERIC|nr:hypothetical protein Vadar_029967 [Vaccinium darrowii]